MAQQELIMPKMGESVAEATIIKWVKNEGDKIKIDETVLEIATDKVDSEIPSPFEGVLVKKLFKEGDVVQVGKPIAIISSDVNAAVETPKTQTPVVQSSVNKQEAVVVKEVAVSHTKHDFSEANRFYSPLVKNIAKQENISLQELEAVKGSGKDGRVTKTDILNYLPNRGKETKTVTVEKTQQNGSSHSQQTNITVAKPAVSTMAG